jgi:hypothetical protein
MTNSENTRKVAVITVHGVGDPGAGSTAQSIVSLLTRLTQTNGKSAYTPFTKMGLTIRNEKVDVGPNPPATDCLRQTLLSRALKSTARAAVSHDPISFIKSQLKDFTAKGDDRTYETVCHSGAREVPGNPVQVEIYEVYWADLMRIGSGALTFFTELYQLMFHVSHLATKTVLSCSDDIRTRRGPSALWGAYETFVTAAAQYLSSFVFLFNIALLPVALLASLLVGNQSVWNWTLIGLTLSMVAGFAFAGFHQARNRALFQIGLVVLALISAAVIGFHHAIGQWLGHKPAFGGHPPVYSATAAIVFFLLLATGAIAAFVFQYDKANPNNRMPALLLGLLFWGSLAAYFWASPLSYEPPASACAPFDGPTWVILQWMLFLTVFGQINYLMLLLLEGIAVIFGVLVLAFEPKAEKERAYRVLGTVLFGLGLPTVLFSLTTITAWAAYTKLVLPDFATSAFVYALSEKLLALDSQGFPITVAGAGVALLTAITIIGPSIWAELDGFDRSSSTSAQLLANWLTAGSATLFVAIVLLFLAGMAPLGWFFGNFAHGEFLSWDNQFSAPIVLSLVGGLGLTALALKDHLGEWTLALGPILNKILDVDSYLRQFPRDCTPKARTFCRYASLLRHVVRQEGVEKIIILSYSQGTVITADLLKFLNDPTVPCDDDLFTDPGSRKFKKEIHLFTMGCPLRQLYSARFPTWYDWARVDSVAQPRATVKGVMTLPDKALPMAQQLGVAHWSNAYGTGDYIGRALWRRLNDGNYASVPTASWVVTQPPSPLSPGSISAKTHHPASEFCIGPFGHLQYWNEPGDAVARELDRLIAS